jgi:hypothetical protein
VYKAIDRGELRPVVKDPVQLSASDVEALRERKRQEALERIGLDRLLTTAREVRAQLHPPVMSGDPREHAALDLIPEVIKAAYTMPVLHASAMPPGSGCRWCAALVAGRMLQVPVPEQALSSDVGLALLGEPECETHRGMVRDRMAALRARVHPGGAPRLPQAAVKEAVSPKPPPPTGAAPAPAQAASGSSGGWTPRRRKVTTAAGRPGTLRCGHALAAGCTCPRRASR